MVYWSGGIAEQGGVELGGADMKSRESIIETS